MFGAVRTNSTVRYTYDVLWMARSRAWWVVERAAGINFLVSTRTGTSHSSHYRIFVD